MKYLCLTAVLLFLISVQGSAQISSAAGEQLTTEEIAKLINECGTRTTQMAARLYSYSFTQTETDQSIDKKGSIKSVQSRVFEVYPIILNKHARIIYVQVSENGVAFSPEKIAAERERAAKQTMELEERSKSSTSPASPYRPTFWSYGIKVEKHARLSKSYWYIRPTDFLLGYEFSAPQLVSFNGRKTILLSFRPRPGYVYDATNVPYPEGIEDYGRAMSQLGGRLWIDAADKVIARIEASPVRKLATTDNEPDQQAAVRFEFKRLSTGTWVPSESSYNSYGREDVFWKTPMSRTLAYDDFKLFKTTADVEKTEPAPPPSW